MSRNLKEKYRSGSLTLKLTILLLGFITLLLLLVGTVIVFSPAYFRNKIETRFKEASNGLYQLHISDLDIDYFSGSIRANNIALEYDSLKYEQLNQNPQARPLKVKLFIPEIEILNIEFRTYFSDSVIDLDNVTLKSPEIHLESYYNDSISVVRNRLTTADTNFISRLPLLVRKITHQLNLKKLSIVNGSISYKYHNKKGILKTKADSINFSLAAISIGTSNKHNIFYADLFKLYIKNFELISPENLYTLKIKDIRTSQADSTISISGIKYFTKSSDKEFKRKSETRTRYNLEFDKIEVRGIDLYHLVHQNSVGCRRLQLEKMKAVVTTDKRIDKVKDRTKHLPNELFQKINFPFRIDTLILANSAVTYFEYDPGSSKARKVEFNGLKLTAFPINNQSDIDVITRFQARINILNTSPAQISFQIPLNQPNFSCTFKGKVAGLNALEFNKLLLPSDKIRLKKGELESITFSGKLNDYTGSGSLLIVYQNLKIEVIDPGTNKKKKFLSKLGNLFVRNKNKETKKHKAKTVNLYYTRDESDNFIKYLWNTVKTGILPTIAPAIEKNKKLLSRRDKKLR